MIAYINRLLMEFAMAHIRPRLFREIPARRRPAQELGGGGLSGTRPKERENSKKAIFREDKADRSRRINYLI